MGARLDEVGASPLVSPLSTEEVAVGAGLADEAVSPSSEPCWPFEVWRGASEEEEAVEWPSKPPRRPPRMFWDEVGEAVATDAGDDEVGSASASAEDVGEEADRDEVEDGAWLEAMEWVESVGSAVELECEVEVELALGRAKLRSEAVLVGATESESVAERVCVRGARRVEVDVELVLLDDG